MIKRIACAAAVTAALTTGTLGLAGPASAASVNGSPTAFAQPNINRVTCGTRTDWLRIFSNATTCWANPGSINVTLYNVYEWCGGNNSGYLRTSRGIQNFKAHTCGVFPPGTTATVTQIVIYA
ncbi:MAG: hypothetical protein DLM59_14500 [Pseudonocardiales bacterium]|nr:MAG: hypothetical protein DLM59_14500 [Pseudonocardiales bacterium]